MKNRFIDVSSSLTLAAIFLTATALSSCTKDIPLDNSTDNYANASVTNYTNGWSTDAIGTSISSRIGSMSTADEKEFWGCMESIMHSFIYLAENQSGFIGDLQTAAGTSEAVDLSTFFQNYNQYQSYVDSELQSDMGLTLSKFLTTTYEFNGEAQIPYATVPDDGGLSDEGDVMGVLGFEGDADDSYGDMYPGVLNGTEYLLTFDPTQVAKTDDFGLTVLVVIGLVAVTSILNNQFGPGGVASAPATSFISGTGTYGANWPNCAEFGTDLINSELMIKDRKEWLSNHTEVEMSYHTYTQSGSTTSKVEDVFRALRVKTIHKNDVSSTTFNNLYAMGDLASTYDGTNGYAVYGVYFDYDWIAGKWTYQTAFNNHVGNVVFRSNNTEYALWRVDKFEWCFQEYADFSNSTIEFQKKAGA